MIQHQRGAYYMPTTPWTARPKQEVDKDAYFKQIQRLVPASKSIICGAATGEAYELAPREMIELVAVAIKAVDGKVYAQIPLTFGWSEVDPGDYGAPDPAQLLSADQGIPAILAATTDVKKGDDVRGGKDNKEVLTTYTGNVPESAAGHLIPGATGDFTATYGITPDGELRTAELTGTFYAGKPSMTYTMTVDDYGTSKDITAP